MSTFIEVPPIIDARPPPPLPASDAHVYTRNLLLTGNGCPLYVPEPVGHSAIYRTKGVRIGDVGIVTGHGAFQTFFNIRAPAHDPINCLGVPDNFEQLHLGPGDITVMPTYLPVDKAITSPRFTESGPFDDVRRVLVLSPPEGAVLHLPNGASRITCISKQFREHARKHGLDWYNFVGKKLQYDIRNGTLCLVTRTDKTDCWMVGAYSQALTPSSLCLRGAPESGANMSSSYTWIPSNAAMRCAGPSDGPHEIDPVDKVRDDTLFCYDAPDGQSHCVFVRGFRISLQPSLWSSVMGYPKPTEILPIEDSEHKDIVGGSEQSPSSIFHSLIPGWSKSSGGGGQQRAVSSHDLDISVKPANQDSILEYMPKISLVRAKQQHNDSKVMTLFS